jgi:hypothetical protein
MTADALAHALDQVDRGAFARRGLIGEPIPNRAAVSEIDHRLRIARIEITMWTLHDDRCPTYENHRWMAERVVDALFPPGAMS